ncbi:hypothetical protein chiPu_0006723 [Chiloscyllium punctatum]|uniref:Uncharacterized protein n=1 Tax=Chiloscyllium punctatum TaxID=137246 RepID=A0A401SD69_CHIPU|nr:hypothetical protein [Chiloscyllium punctatum]
MQTTHTAARAIKGRHMHFENWRNVHGDKMLASLMGVFIAVCFEVESRRPEATHAVNFLDNEKWLTTVSQYDKELRYWNKFRDDDYFRSWNPSKPFDQGTTSSNPKTLKSIDF